MWVEERLRAVATLFSIRPEGLDMLLDLDVRQMKGQPGYFGSYGYRGWTGIGQAKPAPVMHELGHAYWGAFPVTGFPDLSWEVEEGRDVSPAMARYRRDVLEFMKQPAGPYELFRSILRNIPGLSEDSLDGLFHSVEADIAFNTGGDLHLLPPILRKYWDRFLQPGPWRSWHEAAAWFQGISGHERAIVNQYLGFEHIDLEQYGSLAGDSSILLPEEAREAVRGEERQRLMDFAAQFDVLLGASEYGANFGAWRGYLREILVLHKAHPGLLGSLDEPRAGQVRQALDFLTGVERDGPRSKAEVVSREIDARPFLGHFLPALDNRTLLAMFRAGTLPKDGSALAGTRAFVRRLDDLGPTVDLVLGAAQRSPQAGAAELTRFVLEHAPEDRETLALLFELLGDSDHATTGRLLVALEDSTIRHLLRVIPATVRSRLEPGRLLEALSVTPGASAAQLRDGIDSFVAHTSGNFRIDRPQLKELFAIIVVRADRSPRATLDVVGGSRFPWEGFIGLHPDEAVRILSTDLGAAAEIVKRSDELTFPPARFVYRLVYADPEFAAQVVQRLHDDGEGELVVEALAHIAYDAHRLAAVPGLAISLENDGRFLLKLLNDRGAQWLQDGLAETVRVFAKRVEEGEVPRDFLEAYRDTLDGAVALVSGEQSGESLRGVVREAFAAGRSGR